MLLLKIQTASGRKHQCDARCYNARPGTKCACQCCGGRNHSIGENKAIENMQAIYAQGSEGLPAGSEIIKVPSEVMYTQQRLPIPAMSDPGRIVNWPNTTATNLTIVPTLSTSTTVTMSALPDQLTINFP